MSAQEQILFTVLWLSLPSFAAPIQAQPEQRTVGLANPEEPLVLKGLRGGPQTIGAKVIRISDCVFDSLNIVGCQQLTLEGSIVHSYANLVAEQSATVRNCEFYGSVTWDTSGGSAVFEHNVFTKPLVLQAATVEFRRPTIIGNSFLGMFQAVEVQDPSGVATNYANLKLPLGGNYWGTGAGPNYPGGPILGWLEPKGAFCQHWDGKESYLYTGFVTTANAGDGWRPHPQVWVQEARAGQNVLGYTIGRSAEILARAGRDLLVCFDLKTTRSGYAPRFSLLCNGEALSPQGGDTFTVLRLYPAIAEGSANHQRTLNFVVPANQVKGPELELKLVMDARDIGGYAGAGEAKTIWESTLQPKPAFCRPLRIGVVPVNVRIPFWITANADADATVKRLEAELPALWPLVPGRDYQVLRLPPISIERGYLRGAFQGLTAGAFMTFALSRSASAYLEGWNAARPRERWLDRLVCVVPNTTLNLNLMGLELSSNEGAALGLYQSVVFVDESTPQAVLHELGHSIGLYTGSEQYAFSTIDNLGNPIAQVIFNGKREKNGANLRNAVLFNDTGFRDFGQLPVGIHHVPPSPSRIFFDLMGASTPIWIIPTSLESVYRGLYGLLGGCADLEGPGAGGSVADGAPSPALMGLPPNGYRRVVFTGLLRRYQNRDTLAYTYRVYPDSVQARDVSLEDYQLGEGNRSTLQYIEALDSAGQPVQPRIPITGRFTDPALSPEDPPWFQVVDLPDTTRRIVITDQELPGWEALSLADDGEDLQAHLTATPPSGTIEDTITLEFGLNAGAKTLPVFLQLYYSADGQTTWVPIGGMTTSTSITVDARTLPATDDLVFRVVVADAFRSAESRMTGFRVANRAPLVSLQSPHPNDAAAEDAVWVLAAEVLDLEDGQIRTGEWRSSRDGVLGTATVLPEVRLSAGEHSLTFTAVDQDGLSATASVQVHSGPVAQVDLAVDEAALRIRVAGTDPTVSLPNRLQTDRLSLIRVAVRNGGLTNEARLSLFIALENAPEQLLTSQVVTNWPPFTYGTIEAAYAYPGADRYTLRAVISDALIPDPDPANDSRSWDFRNEAPIAAPARFDVTPQTPIDLLLSGFDPDGDPLQYRLVTGPTRGVIEPRGETWRYVPLNAGQDSITFTVSDGRFESAPAAVTFFTSTAAAPVPVPPSIVSADRVFATAGTDFTHPVVVTASPATFAAYGLPDGLQIHPATGVISGRTGQPGEFVVFVEAGKNGATSTQELKLRVQDTFERWIAGFGLTGADAAPEVDLEPDGLTNLQEYAHGTDPTQPDAASGMTPSVIREALGLFSQIDYLVVTYRQRIGGVGNPAVDYAVDGVRYRLEYIESLDETGAWESGDQVFEVLESQRMDNGDGTEWISVRCQVPVTYTSQGYVRLRITPR